MSLPCQIPQKSSAAGVSIGQCITAAAASSDGLRVPPFALGVQFTHTHTDRDSQNPKGLDLRVPMAVCWCKTSVITTYNGHISIENGGHRIVNTVYTESTRYQQSLTKRTRLSSNHRPPLTYRNNVTDMAERPLAGIMKINDPRLRHHACMCASRPPARNERRMGQ